jgi:hypothetical protein
MNRKLSDMAPNAPAAHTACMLASLFNEKIRLKSYTGVTWLHTAQRHRSAHAIHYGELGAHTRTTPADPVFCVTSPKLLRQESHLRSTRTPDHAPFRYRRLGQQLDHPCGCNTTSLKTACERHPDRLNLEHGQTNVPTWKQLVHHGHH